MTNQAIDWLTARPIAHRGLHDAARGIIENCPQAFERAIAGNFAIELDVQVTRDGRAVVFHDYELDRLTKASGRIDEHEMAELSRIAFRNTSDQMLELPVLLDLVAGRVPLVIELKTAKCQDGRLERAVCEAVATYDGEIALMTFSPVMLEGMASLTDRPRGIVSCDFFRVKEGRNFSDEQKYQLTHLLHAAKTRPDFISYCQKDLPAPAVDLLKQLYDLPVICWTTKDVECHRHALQFCDQVTFEGYNPDQVT